MRKNGIILFLTILSIGSIVFGIYQKNKADEYNILAQEMQLQAEMQAEKARSNAERVKRVYYESIKQAEKARNDYKAVD